MGRCIVCNEPITDIAECGGRLDHLCYEHWLLWIASPERSSLVQSKEWHSIFGSDDASANKKLAAIETASLDKFLARVKA